MTDNGCGCKFNCLTFGAAAALIVGIITAFLRITSAAAASTSFLTAAFGIAILFLLLSFTAAALNGGFVCRCAASVKALLAGIAGTVATALILSARSFAEASVAGAVITGLLLFFFTLMLLSAVCFVKCAAECNNT